MHLFPRHCLSITLRVGAPWSRTRHETIIFWASNRPLRLSWTVSYCTRRLWNSPIIVVTRSIFFPLTAEPSDPRLLTICFVHVRQYSSTSLRFRFFSPDSLPSPASVWQLSPGNRLCVRCKKQIILPSVTAAPSFGALTFVVPRPPRIYVEGSYHPQNHRPLASVDFILNLIIEYESWESPDAGPGYQNAHLTKHVLANIKVVIIQHVFHFSRAYLLFLNSLVIF